MVPLLVMSNESWMVPLFVLILETNEAPVSADDSFLLNVRVPFSIHISRVIPQLFSLDVTNDCCEDI